MPPRAGWWKPIVWAAAVALVVVALGLFGRAEPPGLSEEPAVAPAAAPVTLGDGDLAAAPQVAAITIDVAETLARQGDLVAAERAYRDAVAQAPDSAAAHAGLGRVLLALGHRREAVRALRRAARLAPRDPDRRVDLAIAEADRPRRARRQFHMALRAAGLHPGMTRDDPSALAELRPGP